MRKSAIWRVQRLQEPARPGRLQNETLTTALVLTCGDILPETPQVEKDSEIAVRFGSDLAAHSMTIAS